jgi:hypothetical protein
MGLDRAGKKIACRACVRACVLGRARIHGRLRWNGADWGGFLALRGSWGADTAWRARSGPFISPEFRAGGIICCDGYHGPREGLPSPTPRDATPNDQRVKLSL